MEAAKQPVGSEVCHLGNFFEAQALRKMMNKVKRSIAKILGNIRKNWSSGGYILLQLLYLESKAGNEFNLTVNCSNK